MFHIRKVTAAAAAALAISASGAIAAVLTFDADTNGAVYMEGDATITSIAGDNVNTYSGNLGFPCCVGNPFEWEMTVAGGLFDLQSIDVKHVDLEDPVTFTGLNSGGTVATQIFNSNAGVFNFAGFVGLDALRISMATNQFGDPTFDDLTYTPSAVPLPAALPLLLAALGGLGIARRRRKAA